MDLKTLRETPPWEWPSDAGKTFQKVLVDSRAKVSDRVVAAELAGDVIAINDDLANALLTVLRSPGEPAQLRAMAAISCGPVLEQTDISGFDDPDDVPPITERTFRSIQESLQKLYADETIPTEVRRRILEASVRAEAAWHRDAILAAYSSGDRDWKLTAVFAMRFIRGFDEQILEALKSADPEIHYEAVSAAGNWALDGAWSHVAALVNDAGTPRPLLLAAISAVGYIRPAEARRTLRDLADSDDEEIAEAAQDAIGMAEAISSEAEDEEADEEEGEEDGEEWVN